MLEKYLQEIGLTDKEASIYLALLQVDNASVASMSQKTKIKRPTVYVVLESLLKKGLVSQVQIGKKTHYQAEPPERLETYVERRKIMLDEQSRRLKDIIPQIKIVQREMGERPIIKYFEGRDGAISAYEEFYEMHNDNKTKEGYFIYNRDLLKETFTEKERDKFRSIRLGKNVQPVSVYTKKEGDEHFEDPGKRSRIDSQKYPIQTDITIIEDRIIISTLGNAIVSILIKNKDLAVTLASLVRYINDKNEKGGK